MKISIAETIRRADALYFARGEIAGVRTSIWLMDEALAEAFDYELAWRQGRALFFLGQESQEAAAARQQHLRASDICRRAARMEPSRVEGHFWLGVNLALLAALEGPIPALRHALSARRSLMQAASIDPAHHGAGPLRVLARLEAKLPKLVGGGRLRAKADFEKALALAPSNTVTRLYFAELLLEINDEAQARRQLEAILNSPQDPAWAFETARDRRLAQQMLEKIG